MKTIGRSNDHLNERLSICEVDETELEEEATESVEAEKDIITEVGPEHRISVPEMDVDSRLMGSPTFKEKHKLYRNMLPFR